MRNPNPSPPDFTPIRVLDVELSEPLLDILRSTTNQGFPFGRVRVLVRLHSWPLGFVELPLGAFGVSAEALAAAVDAELRPRVNQHLADDGARPVGTIESAGIRGPADPKCLEARRRILLTPPRTSVVVPTIDRPEALRRCLQQLIAQHYPTFEIVVVDNAPGESGADAVVASIDAEDRDLRYVAESRRGASSARNQGLAVARGDIVAFLDGDARPDRSWLAALVTSMQTPIGEESVSCVTGLILPGDIETQHQLWMEEWGGFSKGFDRNVFDLRGHRPDSPLYPFAAAIFGSGANMSFRASVLRDLGGFDLALGGGTPSKGGEDLASFLDMISNGRTLVYEPGAIVWHEHAATERQFRSTLHSYGIGLTSFIARHVWRHPRDAIRIASALPAAARYFFVSGSPKNAARSATFPSVWRDEVGGMMRGPIAYAVGRARVSRERRRSRT